MTDAYGKGLSEVRVAVPVLLKQSMVAELTGLAESTLKKYRMTGEGPRFIKMNHRTVRYRAEDVCAWLDSFKPQLTIGDTMSGVRKTMHEFKKGKLHSGSKKGPVVKSRKQALAIALKGRKKKGKAKRGY